MHKQKRSLSRIVEGLEVLEGAGVKIQRFIGIPGLAQIDPFLMLDEFRSDDPKDYIAGFPPHPHRGFETVTYMLEGQSRHKDSAGNHGLLQNGDVQWMTAGSGIIHSEMPEQKDGRLWGYQLWVNLPADLKMTEPRYQDISSAKIPEVAHGDVKVRLIAGELNGVRGAADTFYPITYFDLHMDGGGRTEIDIPGDQDGFIYVYTGVATIDGRKLGGGKLGLLGPGDGTLEIESEAGARMLLVAGRPLNEPIARGGPFVMNTQRELRQAFTDYQSGNLVQNPK